jgi:hypothetical protein
VRRWGAPNPAEYKLSCKRRHQALALRSREQYAKRSGTLCSPIGPITESLSVVAAHTYRHCALAVIGGVFLMMLNFSMAQSAKPKAERSVAHVERSQLCVTNGIIETRDGGWLSIETPSSRAVVPSAVEQVAEIRFKYLGPSASAKPLASGELRRQIGLKLRAQDSCNLLYAMWHIEADSELVVLVKRNPGLQTHAQCGARGYFPVKAVTATTLAKVRPGELHILHAELRDNRLTLTTDGVVVWDGQVPTDVRAFDGPVGLRTDNGRFELEYFAVLGNPAMQGKSSKGNVARCSPSPGD